MREINLHNLSRFKNHDFGCDNMMPNINPRQMEQMMRKIGCQARRTSMLSKSSSICSDKKIIIDNPSVQKVNDDG